MAIHNDSETYDFVIIGSGFGGSVSAMRLAQKGYKVAVLEQGKKWDNKDFPKHNWQIKKYFWSPVLKLFGPQAITILKGLMVAHGVGVGGGSLVYASTLLRPKDSVFKKSDWLQDVNWAKELGPHYDTAEKMLGVTENKYFGENERLFKKLATDLGVEQTLKPSRVCIFFGDDNQKPHDPYFSGDGPERSPCQLCGGCMVGCRHNAKNTLDKNYLFFAEKWGAKIFPETRVGKIIPNEKVEGYTIETSKSTSWRRHPRTIFRAKNIVVSAGVLGTTRLLLKNRDEYKTLPKLSKTLGTAVRTNGESLLSVSSLNNKIDYTKGISIGASCYLNEETKMELIRYPKGSGFMSIFGVPLTDGGNRLLRPLKLIASSIFSFPKLAYTRLTGDWASKTVVFVVMQSVEEKLSLVWSRSPLSWFKRDLNCVKSGPGFTTYQPIAQSLARKISKMINGVPQNASNEVLFDIPTTAHMLGGVPMGENSQKGVVDTNHEVHGYKGLYVSDGSIVGGNLGVNPSLTITAMTERFCSTFPANPKADQNLVKSRQIHFSQQEV